MSNRCMPISCPPLIKSLYMIDYKYHLEHAYQKTDWTSNPSSNISFFFFFLFFFHLDLFSQQYPRLVSFSLSASDGSEWHANAVSLLMWINRCQSISSMERNDVITRDEENDRGERDLWHIMFLQMSRSVWMLRVGRTASHCPSACRRKVAFVSIFSDRSVCVYVCCHSTMRWLTRSRTSIVGAE